MTGAERCPSCAASLQRIAALEAEREELQGRVALFERRLTMVHSAVEDLFEPALPT